MQKLETQVLSLDGEDPLEEEMATHASILAGRIKLTEEPGGLQSKGPQSQSWLSIWATPIYPSIYLPKGFKRFVSGKVDLVLT